MDEDKATGQVVLVVDDSADTRSMMKQFLELEGYRVLEATGGAEAVEVARRERPRLILLDLSIPYIDGLNTARRLRDEPESSETPIVIISALDVAEVQEVISEGYGYIPKPVDFAHLKALIGVTFGG
jgi:DNA-binding response OmpR family regulator